MIKFKYIEYDFNECTNKVKYEAYRNGILLKTYSPINEDSKGNLKFSTFITKEAVEFINYELIETKQKPITKAEEKQIFEFYYKGNKDYIKYQIEKHKEEINKLKKKL